MSESEDDGAFESADEGSEEEVSEVVQTHKFNDEPQLDRSQKPLATKDQHGDRLQEPPATTDQHGEPDVDDATATKVTEGMNDTKMANEIKGAEPPNEVSETVVPKADVTHGAKSDDDITDGDGADGDDIGSVNVVISGGKEKNDVEDRTGSEKNIRKKGATEHVDSVALSPSVTDRTPEEKKSKHMNSSTLKNPNSVNTMQREDSPKEERSEVSSADVPADNMNIKQTKQKQTSAVNEKSAPPRDESISREDRGMCAASGEREPCEKRLEEPSAASALDRLTGGQQQQAAGGWGWGSWGSSIISTATSSVSTFTNSVGEGFNSVLDTVESTIGAPNPEELVELQRAGRIKEPQEGSNGIKDHQSSSDEPDDDGTDDLIPLVDPKAQEQENRGSQGHRDDQGHQGHRDDQGGWFQNWDNITDMSKTLVTGGLDVLEVIGKKTFDVIAEGDGGIKSQIKKRKEKPNLSQVLREAAQERENDIVETVEVDENKTAHFGTLFDEYNGLVHLETLESVSSQCELNVESLLSNIPGEQLATLRDDLLAITKVFKDVEDESENDCDDVSEHEFVQIISEHIDSLAITLDCEKIVKVHKDITEWLKTCADEQDEGVQKDCKDIHYRAIDYLAEMTVCCVEIFHKIAQLIQLHPTTSLTTYRHKAQHIAGLQTTFSNEVDIITTKFSECLNTSADDSEDPDSVTPFITNVYLESTNSKSYANDAVQLLLPVLQNTALQAVQDQASQDT